MTVMSDVKKALDATFHMEDRERLHWFLGLRTRQDQGKVTIDQDADQCKPSRTPADFNLKLQTERRRRSGPEDLQRLGWITSVTGETDEAIYHVHSQHSVQTHECTYQSTLDVQKTTSAISSRFKRFKTYLHKRI